MCVIIQELIEYIDVSILSWYQSLWGPGPSWAGLLLGWGNKSIFFNLSIQSGGSWLSVGKCFPVCVLWKIGIVAVDSSVEAPLWRGPEIGWIGFPMVWTDGVCVWRNVLLPDTMMTWQWKWHQTIVVGVVWWSHLCDNATEDWTVESWIIVFEGKIVFSSCRCECLCFGFFISGTLIDEIKEQQQRLWWTTK